MTAHGEALVALGARRHVTLLGHVLCGAPYADGPHASAAVARRWHSDGWLGAGVACDDCCALVRREVKK